MSLNPYSLRLQFEETQTRPGTPLRKRLHTMEKGLGQSASIRDVVSSIGDTGSTRPDQVNAATSTSK